MAKVTLLPEGKTIDVDETKSLLKALRDNGVYIKSSCGGVASCSDCIIKIMSGLDNLSDPPFEEISLLGNVFHITKERLACQAKALGDVTIDISAHDRASDEEKLRSKTQKSFTRKNEVKTRKKEEVEAMYKERREATDEKNKERDEGHLRHWEKEKDPMKPKSLGGGKRPKPFRTDHLEEEQVADTESTIEKENHED